MALGIAFPPTACKSQTTTSPVTTMPEHIVPDESPSPRDMQALYGLARLTTELIEQGAPPSLAVVVDPETGKMHYTTPAHRAGGAAPSQRTINSLIKTININDQNSTTPLQQGRTKDQDSTDSGDQ